MGKPNSTLSDKALEAYLLKGTTPSVDTLCTTGLDVAVLEERYAGLRPQLRYLEGSKPLQDACSDNRPNPDRAKSWRLLAGETGHALEHVLRFATPTGGRLLRLTTTNLERSRDVEVFLLKSGTWLIWDGGEDSKKPYVFTEHRTATDAVERLKEIAENAGTEFRYWSTHYAGIYYTPNPESKLVGGVVLSVALALAKHLSTLLQTSIEAKEDRLKTQKDLQAIFAGVDARSGLNGPNA